MEMSLDLWIEYLLRFSHLVAGISWIGSSFYFIWLDSSFRPPISPRHHVEGETFMVHGGFYYQVEKKKIYPGELPPTLHWFKWEATLTWATGFLLLTFLYYLRGASFLIDPRIMELTQAQAIGLSLGLVVVCWFLYDLIWHPRFTKHQSINCLLSALLLAATIYLVTHCFSGRGAFIQVGFILGSLMLLNVWVRILPGQSQMLKDAQAGKVPDYSVSLKSKVRSVHNTYFIFPVLFIMLSNHYPTLYNHPYNGWLLVILSISGALVRHAMVTKNPIERWTLVPALVGLLSLIWMTANNKPHTDTPAPVETVTETNLSPIEFSQIEPIFKSRCHSCHSSTPKDDIFTYPPNGLVMETESQILAIKEKVYQRVVIGKDMPFLNKTQMTEPERELVGKWIQSQ